MSVHKDIKCVIIALIIIVLLIITIRVSASPIDLQKTQANNGAMLLRVQNNTSNHLYCWVSYQGGYFDFYIQPYSASRWYYEPNGYYEWRCQ